MMNITEMNTGPKPAWSLDGGTLTIAGLTIDLYAEQEDVQRVISIYDGADGPSVGLAERYIAVITIPPRAYAPEVVEEDMGGEVIEMTIPVAQPCDPATVNLALWAV